MLRYSLIFLSGLTIFDLNGRVYMALSFGGSVSARVVYDNLAFWVDVGRHCRRLVEANNFAPEK